MRSLAFTIACYQFRKYIVPFFRCCKCEPIFTAICNCNRRWLSCSYCCNFNCCYTDISIIFIIDILCFKINRITCFYSACIIYSNCTIVYNICNIVSFVIKVSFYYNIVVCPEYVFCWITIFRHFKCNKFCCFCCYCYRCTSFQLLRTRHCYRYRCFNFHFILCKAGFICNELNNNCRIFFNCKFN